MTWVIQTQDLSLVLGHTKPQGVETCACVEVQNYPEQNPHNLILFQRFILQSLCMNIADLTDLWYPYKHQLTVPHPNVRQEKGMWHHTTLADKHTGYRQFDTFNKKK